MLTLGVMAGLGASFFWALGAMLAHAPARRLGAFEFTRTQLVSSSFVLLILVSLVGGWASVSWAHAPAFGVASVIGVIAGNLAMISCLARGGPRRTQLLMAMNAPIAAIIGLAVLGEAMSARQLGAAAMILAGVVLAIVHRQRAAHEADNGLERIHGPFAVMAAFGVLAATCQAIGLVALKPALTAGTDPLAATALRTAGAALILAVIALWPARAFEPASQRTGRIVLSAIVPGILGYVVAVSLQLYALRSYGAGIAAVLSSAAPVMILPMVWLATRQRPPRAAWMGAGLVFIGVALIAGG